MLSKVQKAQREQKDKGAELREAEREQAVLDMKLVSRKEARARALKWYFTGEPCHKGHISTRSLSSYECHGCSGAFKITAKDKRAVLNARWEAERKAMRANRKLVLDLLS